jgi:hypothetical protein
VSLQTLGTSYGESWNAVNHWFSSKLGFDVPLTTALCKTFLLSRNPSWVVVPIKEEEEEDNKYQT